MRVRRIKPRTVAGRQRQAELNRIISNARSTKAERSAALDELNALAPIAGSLSQDGSSSSIEDSRKPARADLDAWYERIEDRRAGIPKPRTARELDHAKARLQPLLSRGIVNDEIRALAAESVELVWGEDRSADDQAGLVQFQIDAWTGKESVAQTKAAIARIFGITK